MPRTKLVKWIVKDKGIFLNLIGLILCIFMMIGSYIWFWSMFRIYVELERRRADEELKTYIG